MGVVPDGLCLVIFFTSSWSPSSYSYKAYFDELRVVRPATGDPDPEAANSADKESNDEEADWRYR
jgi:hypothetical protein